MLVLSFNPLTSCTIPAPSQLPSSHGWYNFDLWSLCFYQTRIALEEFLQVCLCSLSVRVALPIVHLLHLSLHILPASCSTLDRFISEVSVPESRLAIRGLLRWASCDDSFSLVSSCGRLLSVSSFGLLSPVWYLYFCMCNIEDSYIFNSRPLSFIHLCFSSVFVSYACYTCSVNCWPVGEYTNTILQNKLTQRWYQWWI